MAKEFYCGRFVLDLTRPVIMGIVNLTDDSFSGDGLADNTRAAVEHGLRLVADGAAILDLGAESSRPGALPVTAEQECRRLLPVISHLQDCGVPLSIDTTKPEVMQQVLDAGADMINDINALRAARTLQVIAGSQAGVCLMHMQRRPQDMQIDPSYTDVVSEVAAFLAERVSAANAYGISSQRIAIDPGFGFGKTLEHNLALLSGLRDIDLPNIALLVGMSRKSMLGAITGRSASERVAAGLVAHMRAIQGGARIIRTHDVAATKDAIAVLNAVATADDVRD